MEKEVGFEHLHLHTDFSLLDGYGQVEEYADRAPQINQQFLCITDHGMMGAIPRQIRACEVVGIQPLFGIELYLNDKHVPKSEMGQLSESEKEAAGKNYHLLAIAYTNQGYSNLVQLSSKAWQQFYKKPRVKYHQIDEHKEGVIFTSSCYIGEIGQTFDKYGPDAAEDVLKRYINWFSPNFYLEMMLLDFKKQKPYDAWLVKMHDKYHVPMVVTGDCHYCRKQDSQQQRRMLMIRGKKTEKDFENIEDGQDYFELQDSNLWMKSEDELDEMWLKKYRDVIPEEVYTQAKRNTVEIARKASGVEIDRSIKLPQIPDADAKLKEAVMAGYKWRGFGVKNKYINRLVEEINLICKKGFSAYFLIQQEIIKEARRVSPQLLGWGNGDEAIGPGRGCLSPDTRIVMGDGSCKPISDVVDGDLVVTRDGSVKSVKKTLVYDCDEDLINLKVYYGDNAGVSLTEDHKVLVEKCIRPVGYYDWSKSTKKSRKSCVEPKGELTWLPASKVEKDDWLFIPKPISDIDQNLVIDLASYDCGSNVVVEGDFLHQDWLNPLTGKLRKRKTCKRYVNFDADWAELLGLFTGDGWLTASRDTSVGFAFHSEDVEGIEFVTRICNRYGWDYSVKSHAKKKLKQFFINSRILYYYFKNFYCDYKHTSQTKHVPEVVFRLPEHLKMSFLCGYMMSDGHRSENKLTYTTSSICLASQIRYLSWQCGIPASMNYFSKVNKRNGKVREGFKINYPEDGMVKYNYKPVFGGILVKVRKVEKVKGTGKVYDLTVSDNHNYLTTSFLVHNSCVGSLVCYCLGITDVDPLKHDLLFSRFLSEARGGREMKTHFTGVPIPDDLYDEELD